MLAHRSRIQFVIFVRDLSKRIEPSERIRSRAPSEPLVNECDGGASLGKSVRNRRPNRTPSDHDDFCTGLESGNVSH